jgi:hypothetical protein
MYLGGRVIDARADVAVDARKGGWRADLVGGTVLLGSTTPSRANIDRRPAWQCAIKRCARPIPTHALSPTAYQQAIAECCRLGLYCPCTGTTRKPARA